MKLFKLVYSDEETKKPMPFVSSRVEYFFHYWRFLFSNYVGSYDDYYLKSHRTIIDKIRLQIVGNHYHALPYVKYFLDHGNFFHSDNAIVKSINDKKTRSALKKLMNFSKHTNKTWRATKQSKLLAPITVIQHWLDNEYCELLSERVILVLERDTDLTEQDKDELRMLANCFIVELFHKGFSSKFVKEVPEKLNSIDDFPYERLRSDFISKEEYKEYKNDVWNVLTLKGQIEGILRLIARPNRKQFFIYRVFDINWVEKPYKLLDVEFYNPGSGFNPKIKPAFNDPLMKETFTSRSMRNQSVSLCNAFVEVEGIHEEQMYLLGYRKVLPSLNIINHEFNLEGKISTSAALITNEKLNQLWGSSDALIRSSPLRLDDYKANRLAVFDKFNLTNPNDQKLIELISSIDEVLSDKEVYEPERFWIILESYFGDEKRIKSVLKNIFKIYLRYNYLKEWKVFFFNALNPIIPFSDPEQNYKLSKEACKKFSINDDLSKLGVKKFTKSIGELKKEKLPPFITSCIDMIEKYINDKAAVQNRTNDWLEYTLSELYSYRNLILHKRISDDMFLLRKQQMNRVMSIAREIILKTYLDYPQKLTIQQLLRKIDIKAGRL